MMFVNLGTLGIVLFVAWLYNEHRKQQRVDEENREYLRQRGYDLGENPGTNDGRNEEIE